MLPCAISVIMRLKFRQQEHLQTVSHSSQKRFIQLIIPALILIGAWAIWAVGIDAMHMRPDEELTFRNTKWTLEESLYQLAFRDNQTPMWRLVIWSWQRLMMNHTEFIMRIHAMLISLLTLSVLYQIAKHLFKHPRYGWYAMAIMAANSYFFIYSLEFRLYGMVMFVATLSMRFYFLWLDKQTWQSALLYGVSVALLMYTHYYLAFLVVTQVIVLLIFAFIDWSAIRENRFNQVIRWQMIGQAIGAGGLMLLLWLPGLILLYRQLIFINFGERGGLLIPTQPTTWANIRALGMIVTSGNLWLYLGFVILGAVLLGQKRSYWLALFWLFLSSGVMLIANLFSTIYTQRYIAYFVPAVGLVVGAAIAAIPQKYIRYGILVGVVALSTYGIPDYIPQRLPYRHLYQEVSSLAQPNDVLLVFHNPSEVWIDDQLFRALDPTLVDNMVGTVQEARPHRRIWYLTNNWFDDPLVQPAFRALEQTHRVEAVVGDCTRAWCYLAQLMVSPPQRFPTVFGEQLGYMGEDIEITDDAINALLWWEVNQVVPRDYSIALQLVDSDGTLINQVDRQIQPPNFEQIPTSQLIPYNSYVDERIIALPDDLATGTYTLQLVVYDWEDGERLTLEDGRDVLIVREIEINQGN